MPIGKKLMVVLSVLAIGGSAAIFFRKDASQVNPQEAPGESPFRHRIERRIASDAEWSRSAGERLPSESSRPKQALRVPSAATASISESRSVTPEHQPTFRQSFNPVGALLDPIETAPNDQAEPDPGDLADPVNPSASSADGFVRHRIADGDTLLKLAASYLDRADRYLEIFQLNRDVLTSPDLLPIGRELKIPPRSAQPAGDPLREPATTTAGPEFEPPLPLVPVPKS